MATTPAAVRVRLEDLAPGMIYKTPEGRARWIEIHSVDAPVAWDSQTNRRDATVSYVNGKDAGAPFALYLLDQGHKGHYAVRADTVPADYVTDDDTGLTGPDWAWKMATDAIRKRQDATPAEPAPLPAIGTPEYTALPVERKRAAWPPADDTVGVITAQETLDTGTVLVTVERNDGIAWTVAVEDFDAPMSGFPRRPRPDGLDAEDDPELLDDIATLLGRLSGQELTDGLRQMVVGLDTGEEVATLMLGWTIEEIERRRPEVARSVDMAYAFAATVARLAGHRIFLDRGRVVLHLLIALDSTHADTGR